MSGGSYAVPTLILFFGLSPVSAQSREATSVELDIPFVPSGESLQQLDLYVPAAQHYPTILFVHGGSLTSGDRKDHPYPQLCRTFQGLGIGCATTNYRLAPAHKWPGQPDDVAAAFRWLRENIGARGGDPDRIFLFGHSAGCWLVAIVAADEGYLARQGLEPEHIAGVIPMGCRLNDDVELTEIPPSRYEASWVPPSRLTEFMQADGIFTSLEQRNAAVPASHVSPRLPPTLVLVAEEERFFPPILRDAAEFVGRALVQKVDAELAILDNRRHMTAIELMVTTSDETVVKIVDFVRSH